MRAHGLYTHMGPADKSDLAVLRHIWDDLDNKTGVQRRVNTFIDTHH
jgi:hypothetical protein